MMQAIDTFLDGITMYRLLLYYLIGLLLIAMLLSFGGILHYDPLAIVFDSLFLVAVCWLTNNVFSKVFRAPANRDSALITALILALIISPTSSARGGLFLLAAGVLAMASKYMLAFRWQHIFNPAAIAVVLTGFAAGDGAGWWVGSTPMLAFVLIGGVLVVRKVQATRMVLTFIGAATFATITYTLLAGGSTLANLGHLALSSPLFFLAFVMLLEPFSAPATAGKQTIYALLVGMLFPPQFHLASFYMAPELALCVGNAFTYLAGPRFKLLAHLSQKDEIAPHTYDFVWQPSHPITFTAGQYVEWTLPHAHQDARGERRYFTIASSPTEPTIHLGVKFSPNGSTFKQALLGLEAGSPIVGSRLGGTFVLPQDQERKLAFLAGGIGVTPFRSMLKYLIDTQQQRDVHVLYAAATPADFVYQDVFEAARNQLGIVTTYVSTSAPQPDAPFMQQGVIDATRIRQEIPDYADRLFYISGPHGMVVAIEAALFSLGVHRNNIKTDFFSGYAA